MRIAAVAAFVAACAWCAPAAQASEGEAVAPVVHLVAPAAEPGAKVDPLAATAALRLVTAELAARYQLYARYWPGDRADTPPADAYPRVEVSRAPWPEKMNRVRLLRRGDVFIFEASADGKTFLPVGRRVVKMPRQTFVGPNVTATPQRQHLQATISDVRLNGEPFRDYQQVEIGEVIRPSAVERDGDTFRFRTFGAKGWRDFSGTGVFLYKPVEGDFEVTATVEIGDWGSAWGFAGVVCRSTLGSDGALAGTCWEPDGPEGRTKAEGAAWALGNLRGRDGTYLARVILRRRPGHEQVIGEVLVECQSWDELVGSVARLADRIREGLSDDLGLAARRAAAPTDATPQAAQRLAAAHDRALKMTAVDIAAAAREVDEVLTEFPTCAAAHRTGAGCAALLACQDLVGRFHHRGRFLAGPLASWMLADRLAPARTPAERTAGAWVMFACGYPNAALKAVGALDDAARRTAESRALEMFVTRDYRRLSAEDVLTADPIEQRAWVWATERCGRNDLFEPVAGRLAAQHHSCAYLPCDHWEEVGPGHLFSQQGIVFTYGQDARLFLTDERIPAAERKAAAEKMAQAFGLRVIDDLGLLAERLASTVEAQGLPGGETAIRALMDLYEAARAQPAGPVAPGRPPLDPARGGPEPVEGPLAWRTLEPAALADLERGLFLLRLYRRALFLGRMLGVPVAAKAFCDDVAKAAEAHPGLASYFRGMGAAYMNDAAAATEHLKAAVAAPFGDPLAWLYTMFRWPQQARPDEELTPFLRQQGRGAWQWSLMSGGGLAHRRGSGCAYDGAVLWLAVDDYADWAGTSLAHAEESTLSCRPVVERMPYNVALLASLARRADEPHEWPDAIAACQKLIDLVPTQFGHYAGLASIYKKMEQLDKAIEAGAQAAEHCRFSVGLSNLMGDMAAWCVEAGRLKEALKWGERGAASGSAGGLHGLAVALAANGRRDEALQTNRAIAFRYAGASWILSRFLVEHGYDDDAIHREIRAVLDAHPSERTSAAQSLALGFFRGGATDRLAAALEGPLAVLPADEQKYHLLTCALIERRFKDAIAFSDELAKIRALKPYELLWTYVAMRLSGDEKGIERLQPRLKEHTHDRLYRWHVRHLLGMVDAQEMVDNVWAYDQKAYAHWLMGVEAEHKGDGAAAIEAYKRTELVPVRLKITDCANRWRGALAEVRT